MIHIKKIESFYLRWIPEKFLLIFMNPAHVQIHRDVSTAWEKTIVNWKVKPIQPTWLANGIHKNGNEFTVIIC